MVPPYVKNNDRWSINALKKMASWLIHDDDDDDDGGGGDDDDDLSYTY